ncbi:hypothetical protein JOD24_003327 [Kroppenstedtia sanguinis]
MENLEKGPGFAPARWSDSERIVFPSLLGWQSRVVEHGLLI